LQKWSAGKTAVKMLLAGARVVQLGSVLYQQTPGAVRQILTEIENWMTDNHYQTLVDFRGKMSHARTKHPEAIERLQYIKALVGIQ